MIRATINKTISQKEEIALITNHNFFVRAAIARAAKVIIASVISICFYVIFTAAVNFIGSMDANSAEDLSTFYIAITILASIIFVLYLVTQMEDIIVLHKKIVEIEDKILGSDTPETI